MDLAQRDHGPKTVANVSGPAAPYGTDFLEEYGTVLLNCASRVVFRKPEIQVAFAVGARKSSRAGGESVDKPGNVPQVLRLKDVQLWLADCLGRSPNCHALMLQEADIKLP